MNNEYVEYKSCVQTIKGLLGLSTINTWDTERLHPYQCLILKWFKENLVLADTGDIYANMRTLCDTIDQGNRILLETGEPGDLLAEMGVTEKPEDWQDWLFCIAWTNTSTSLWETVRCNYAAVLWELEHVPCKCRCGCTEGTDLTPEDNLYGKLVGNGSRFSGCGCQK